MSCQQRTRHTLGTEIVNEDCQERGEHAGRLQDDESQGAYGNTLLRD